MIPDPNKFVGNEWLQRRPFVPLERIPMPVKSIPNSYQPPSSTSATSRYPMEVSKTPTRITHADTDHHEEQAPKDWKPVDFSRGQLLKHGVSNTTRFRYDMNKQLKSSSLTSAQRSQVSKMITGNMTSSGLGKRDVKKGLWKLQSQGTLTKGQTAQLMKNFGI